MNIRTSSTWNDRVLGSQCVLMQPFARKRPRFRSTRARARERVLTEWRGVNLAPLEKAASPSTRTLEDILPAVLGGLRMDRRRAEAEIVKVWN